MSTRIIRTAFEQALKASDEDPAEGMLPISAVPEALELLGQDSADEFVLGVFAECAVNRPGQRRGNLKLIPFDKFEEVCNVLLASSNHARHSLNNQSRNFQRSDTSSSTIHDAGGGFEIGSDRSDDEELPSDQGDDAESYAPGSDGDAGSHSSARSSPQIPRKSSKSKQEAASVMPRLLQRAKVPQGARLTAADLIVIAASVGEKLKANDVRLSMLEPELGS